MTLVDVDVVVLTWNDGELLGRCLESVRSSHGVRPHVFVVDNGSDEEAVVDPDVVLLRQPVNLGVARGRNLGAGAGRSPLVCFLDSDARLLPGTLATLAAAVLAGDDIGLAAPVFLDQPPEASAGRAPGLARKLARGLGATSVYAPTRSRSAGCWEVDFAIGACQLFRREAFEMVAGLDESFFYGPEDVDFCLRLRARGWRCVQVEGARCEHPPRRRNRRLLTARGLRHALAIARYLARHRVPA
ncbi:MAG: glycosyltransferase, partial [Actinomycetota bacterium]|nr:glycosyltransferase [Actinomycetota bacterium]